MIGYMSEGDGHVVRLGHNRQIYRTVLFVGKCENGDTLEIG